MVRRRTFAASLVVTFTACASSAPPPQQPVGNPSPPEEPHTNPPPPEDPGTAAPDPAPDSGPQHYHLTRNGDTCEVDAETHCPEGASCNPPPPRRVACPSDVAASGGHLDYYQQGNRCFVYGPPVAVSTHCRPGIHCNPPRPRPSETTIACPRDL
jgi:hypothetical protein